MVAWTWGSWQRKWHNRRHFSVCWAQGNPLPPSWQGRHRRVVGERERYDAVQGMALPSSDKSCRCSCPRLSRVC